MFNDDLSLIYESVLISEMTQEVIDYVDEHKGDLPFDHIFGDKMRIFVPLTGDDMAQEILNSLRSIKDYSGVDLKSGEVVRKIKLDPKYGQGGEKEQKIQMGRAISSLNIDPDTKKRYLNWYARYKDNIQSALENTDYAIILSRAPVDVVRMSDHRNISSCHSQGGSYFKCAVQEAITGGAIAYLVGYQVKEDYEGTDELQEADLFSDSERSVRGAVAPLARFRIRRLEATDGTEMALPDNSMYGNSKIPGFFDAVDSYIREKQLITPQDFQDKKWKLRGGSYEDSSTRTLVRDYFGKDEEIDNDISHHSGDDDDETNFSLVDKAAEMEEELEATNRRFGSMEYCNYGFDVNESDGDPYFSAWGGAKIDISNLGIPDDMSLSVDDNYNIRDIKNGENDDDERVPPLLWSQFAEWMQDNVTNLYGFEINSKELTINFQDEDMNSWDTDAYYSFVDEINDFDNGVEDFLEEMTEALEAAGVIPTTQIEDTSRLKQWEDLEEEVYTKFFISGSSRKNYTLNFYDTILLHDGNKEQYDARVTMPNLSMIIHSAIFYILKDTFKPSNPSSDNGQMEFEKFYENYTNPMAGIDFKVGDVRPVINYQNALVLPKYTITPQSWDDKMFEALDTLDDVYPHVLNVLRLYMYNYFNMHHPELAAKFTPPNLENLKKIYSKYL